MMSAVEETQRPDLSDWGQAPADYAPDEAGDIEAYWDTASPDRNHKDGEGPGAKYGHKPIEITPLHVTLIDSGLEEGKSSMLIHCRLEAPAVLRPSEKDAVEDQEFPAGTIIGIWSKAGLKPLGKLGGVRLWIANGQRQRDKLVFFRNTGVAGRSAMTLFTIRPEKDANGKPKTGEVLRVKNDYREESLPDADKARRERRRQLREQKAESEPMDLDDLPF